MVAVLVVDDDPPIRRMLERTLTAEGYSVETAADGGTALRRSSGRCPIWSCPLVAAYLVFLRRDVTEE